jgi:hypothetical protein
MIHANENRISKYSNMAMSFVKSHALSLGHTIKPTLAHSLTTHHKPTHTHTLTHPPTHPHSPTSPENPLTHVPLFAQRLVLPPLRVARHRHLVEFFDARQILALLAPVLVDRAAREGGKMGMGMCVRERERESTDGKGQSKSGRVRKN